MLRLSKAKVELCPHGLLSSAFYFNKTCVVVVAAVVLFLRLESRDLATSIAHT